jgi:hypothetical protein
MYELNGNVLRVRGVCPSTKGEQAATLKEALRHFPARLSQSTRFNGEKGVQQAIA